MTWSLADMPDLTDRRALVTGVTSGLGETIALELARAGAEVVLAARSEAKLDTVEADLRAQLPQARLRRLVIDLADLGAVRRAAAEAAELGELHLLVNNAGVMATPYHRTPDGFELQMATNHFGPFALTGLLMPTLVASGGGRVVNTSSQAHRLTLSAPLGDPRVERGHYSRWRAYAQSKLADLLFTYELDRRLRDAGLPVSALAAHPGYASTGLMATGRTSGGGELNHAGRVLIGAFHLAGQSPRMGAMPTLMAATADLPGSTYVGPSGFAEMRGWPRIVRSRRLAHDPDVQRRLWEISENATGVRYP
ncbi:oxidoreductase [Nocardioides terrisoli]|uniref:oxidoreductase n=1 Tax=Nocardioides terrisoli TaxID=3388267 RepID=UPI00287BC62F|nr:oxidoreductase [Nocardioides marmorisolisilvae]